MSGVRREARETAREAARRAGMSIGEWLDSIILESAEADDVESRRPAEREYSHYDEEFREDEARPRRNRYAEYDDRLGARAGEPRDQSVGREGRYRAQAAHHHGLDHDPGEREYPPERRREDRARPSGRELHPDAAAPGADRLAAELEQRLPLARAEDRPAIHQGFAELNQRLDDLTRQLGQVATMSAAKAARPDPRNEEPSRALVEVISKLDRRLDQLIAEGRSSKNDIEQRVNAVGRAIAGLNRERPLPVPDPPTPLDQALIEIADRQRKKIDVLAHNSQDPAALRQLESAIVGLQGIVSHVASNDALVSLSDEVRALAGKADRAAANSGSDSVLNALEERIGALAAALAARNQVGQSVPYELAAVIKGLVDKIERVQLTRGDHAALGHLDDRIAKLVEKLNSPSPEVTATNSPPPSPPLAQAPQPIEFALTKPSKLEQAPGAARRPLDPTLPPDHPLEPGSGGSRRGPPGSPAGRIAASESVLIGAKPPVISDPGGNSPGSKSNFIAAARRAAQAAGREAAVKSAASGSREVASTAGTLASRVAKLRALIGGTAAIVIVLGALQIARAFLGSPQEAEVGSPEGQSQTFVARLERPADVAIATLADVSEAAPASSEPASPKPASEPATGRQSAVLATGGGGPLAGSSIVIPIEIARQAPGAAIGQSTSSAAVAAEHEVTGSGSANPATAPVSAASTPSMPAPAPTPAQQTSALSPTASDKLPAAFGSSLRAAAAEGDAAAQYEIAQRYAEGHGVAQNLANAAEWFERAAKQGLAPAQFRLGGLYEKGLGVKKNLETARRFYVAAGQAGNAKALHNLAVLYAEGIDGKPDYQTAARWFGKAAGYGFADSQYNLAILYARGIGLEQNVAEAYKWFALAAWDGDMESAKKRDDLGARLDRQSLNAAIAAIQAWAPEQQPEAAVQVKTPPGGWD